ncbi:MAG: RecX family transcriptional regulator [Candidatus Doudnabacteria bacterium]
MFKKAKPLKDPSDIEHAYNYALFVLNISMRTQGEMREKMQKRGYLPEVIDHVLVKLKEDRYIDDDKYAEIFIRNMKDFKYWGKFMMKQKMMLKKLPTDLIEESLSEQVSLEDEIAIAKKYVEKNFGSVEEVSKMEYEQKQKIKARLVSRGLVMMRLVSFSLCRQVLEVDR